MTSKQPGESVEIELTEVESKLRALLLAVASYIDNGSSSRKEMAGVQVPKELAKEKTVLRWTGGWVRDKLLKVGSHDIDLAINNMTGEHFGLVMQEYLELPGNAEKHGLIEQGQGMEGHDKSKKIAPGLHKIEANPEKSKNLETATTKIMGIDLDLVNLRKETYNEISRNPEMEFGTAEEDAMRRDATVNAMFYNLHTSEVEDFTKRGFEDMAAKIIRTPLEPTQTFKDDPLRVLRLIRFSSRLDYTIEANTAKAMADPEIQKVLKVKISRERVGIELEKMLRGPRPRMALELIHRFGLYKTVFTDPTRDLPSEPDVEYFSSAYATVQSIVNTETGIAGIIPQTLIRGDDERYLAWLCATLIPWADAPTVPHPKPLQRPFHSAYLVAREGFKAPNKISDVFTAALTNGEEIRNLVALCAKNLRRPETVNPSHDATARDTLGMALRRWGSTWRTQVLFNLVYELVLGRISSESTLESYAAFLSRVTKLQILNADTFKPLLKGTDLAKALGTKPGPWMKEALDVVMAWQLRNPESTDPSAAIEEVRASRSEQTKSELSFCLASHFLQLTIPPLFPQSTRDSEHADKWRQATPWKEEVNGFALDLLRWSITALDGKELESKWQFVVPPMLKLMDDVEIKWKARGCSLLRLVLDQYSKRLGEKSKSNDFLRRTGYDKVFADTLLPMSMYLPSLTPEEESVALLQEVIPAAVSLALLLPPDTASRDDREGLLDEIMRTGIVAPLGSLPTPSTYPELATTIVSHVPRIVGYMGIDSVKHLSTLTPLLSAILSEPFALSHDGVVMAALKALQSLMFNAWPRIPQHRGTIMMGVCLYWGRCMEQPATGEGERKKRETEAVVRETMAILDTVMGASESAEVRQAWEEEKDGVVAASGGSLEGLFAGCEGDVGKRA